MARDDGPAGWSPVVEHESVSVESLAFILLGVVATLAVLVHTYLVFVG